MVMPAGNRNSAKRPDRDPERERQLQGRLVLGIESSCDETAAAVVSVHDRPTGTAPAAEILSNAVFGQEDLHRSFGGVVPEIAARAHAERADRVVIRALEEAGIGLADLDAIAVTAGPGLIGGVMAGVATARGLGLGAGIPVIAVNHLEGHVLTPRLSHGVAFPYLVLLASGGHCQFIAVEALGRYRRLGGTIDDAPGEAFDKVAKMLGLGFPGGPIVERWAAGDHSARPGDAARFDLPRPLIDRRDPVMSFSGLKTAVLRARDLLARSQGGLYRQDVADLCASFQAAVADLLGAKARQAMATFDALSQPIADRAPVIAVAGGVAANAMLRAALDAAATAAGFRSVAPPLALCTDNGAMIAHAGAERLIAGLSGAEPLPRPRWPLDAEAAPMLGAGRKGAKA
ncbi:MAG: tRNA (adenosine(37)-N6)-threonylcarbamoyltransferase complex transferase subunit TsaD [Pseudomonadota bacterium]